MPGQLFLVATPIGNLSDMTFRAVEILQQVDLIVAEDTRHSQHLFQHYQIRTPALSFHSYNEEKRTTVLIERLHQGQNIALISDAGTPLISDPGYRFVKILQQQGIRVVPIPGACALITALVASGLRTDKFVFEGFLSNRKEHRRKKLQELTKEPRTVIFYEAKHRILPFIKDCLEIFGENREATIARELTKKFETIHRANLNELLPWLENNSQQQKGEYVVLIHGCDQHDRPDSEKYERILNILLDEMPLKQAVAIAVKIFNGHRQLLYPLALEIKDRKSN